MHREIVDPNVGAAIISPAEPVRVKERGTWSITYTSGSAGIAKGGSVRITIPHGFSLPQVKAFFDPGFTTVETDVPGLSLELKVVTDIFCRIDKEMGHSGAWGRNVFIFVRRGEMNEGDQFTLKYGNQDYYGGEPFMNNGSLARELAGLAEFTVAVDPDGTRSAPVTGYRRIEKQPMLTIMAGVPVERIALINGIDDGLSSQDAILIHVDAFNNPARIERVECPVSRNDVVQGSINVGNKQLLTNPLPRLEHQAQLPVWWGDIHGHTMHSDGLGTNDGYFAFARDSSALDFAAITDHDDIGPRLLDEEWEELKESVQEWYEPGRFVTFLGHEYRNGKCDMNFYYPGSEGPLLRGTDGNFSDPAVISKKMGDIGGLIIPHMHFGADWSGFDQDIYRVMEVYSSHGSSEYKGCPREIPYLSKQIQKTSDSNQTCYVHDILNAGYRLGFTAGSDTHSGRPGFSDWTRVCRTYFGGLTGVFAPELTREAIWNALKARRCFATTGNRSLVYFHVNDAMMGSEIQLKPGKTRKITLKCHGDGEIVHFTIFRSGEAWKHSDVGDAHLAVSLEDTMRSQDDWYYARITLSDGGMAWASPVWVATGR